MSNDQRINGMFYKAKKVYNHIYYFLLVLLEKFQFFNSNLIIYSYLPDK